MKRSIPLYGLSSLLLFIFVFLGFFQVVLASFADLSSGHIYANAIGYVKEQGIVQGYSDGTYRPGAQINRAEFLKIVLESSFSDQMIEECQSSSLKDVSDDLWYKNYVCLGQKKGIIQGYVDDTFRGGDDINLVEASKIIAVAMGLDLGSSDDVWYQPFVESLAIKKAIPTEILGFDALLTRGQMAEMIYRLKVGVDSKLSHDFNSLLTGVMVDSYGSGAAKKPSNAALFGASLIPLDDPLGPAGPQYYE